MSHDATVRELAEAWPGVPITKLDRAEMPPPLRRATRAEAITVAGSVAALHGLAVGIVGTRRLPTVWVDRLRPLVRELVEATAATVVSGGAYGVDALAHEEALSAATPTCVVLASGLLAAGPAGNRALFRRAAREGGAVIADKPPRYRPYRGDFLERNAIVGSMCDALVVVAAPLDSGAMRTAREARRFGRPVLVVPGPVDEELFGGNHELLRRGARICTGARDLLAALGRPPLPLPSATASSPVDAVPARRSPPDAESPEATARAILLAGGSADDAVRASGVSAARVQAIALDLEVGGLLR